ncbi:MAG TPA: ATP-binding cassette domain-containing protein, partial [Burkholderiaceae bacterium]|nr:ATP-binding cassette domain-containing protein [Burkholderiaceae bacterium]
MLLSVRDLRVSFRMEKGQRIEAVRGVSFDVPENSTVALVGESGSGKSVSAMSILNLLPDNAERSGSIQFMGREMLAAPLSVLQGIRGKD